MNPNNFKDNIDLRIKWVPSIVNPRKVIKISWESNAGKRYIIWNSLKTKKLNRKWKKDWFWKINDINVECWGN